MFTVSIYIHYHPCPPISSSPHSFILIHMQEWIQISTYTRSIWKPTVTTILQLWTDHQLGSSLISALGNPKVENETLLNKTPVTTTANITCNIILPCLALWHWYPQPFSILNLCLMSGWSKSELWIQRMSLSWWHPHLYFQPLRFS